MNSVTIADKQFPLAHSGYAHSMRTGRRESRVGEVRASTIVSVESVLFTESILSWSQKLTVRKRVLQTLSLLPRSRSCGLA